MADDIKPDIIKKTQAALNKYIKKPPLTDKLLRKPPFRFLHDIVTTVIKETGFLKGVFTLDELVADNVKDRDSKIKFLTKLINAVKDATGTPLKAKPGKIVAGLEADKTLELLQAIAKGISSQNNGKKATPANQNNKKKLEKDPSEKSNSKPENDVTERKVAAEEIQNNEVTDTSATIIEAEQEVVSVANNQAAEDEGTGKKKRERRKSLIAEGTGDDKKERKRKSAKEERKNKEDARRESFPSTPLITNGDVDEPKMEKEERLLNGFSEDAPANRRGSSRGLKKGRSTDSQEKIEISIKSSEETEIKIETKTVNGTEEAETKPRMKTEENNVKRRSKNSAEKVSESGSKRSTSGKIEDEENTDKKDVGGGDAPLPKRPTTRRASTRSSRLPLKALVEKDGKNDIKEEEGDTPSDNKGEAKKKTEKHATVGGPTALGSSEGVGPRPPTAQERPRTARKAPPSARPPSARPRPPSARPPSALPGAPKARDRGNVEVDINKDQGDAEIKEVAVITENDKIEDKEEMIVLENQSISLNEADNMRDDTSSVMEGVLVDTILETQSELKKKTNRPQVDIEWESGSKEKREAWQKECERLRQGVQALTRASGPLGKLFDFLQEDVDLATRELTTWRQASLSYSSQLAAEERLTEETLSRHRKKLAELDILIEEQHDVIRSVKASIMANDKKIQALISRPSVAR